jgi:phenylalanyl-tRNA synthetase alpha subunit
METEIVARAKKICDETDVGNQDLSIEEGIAYLNRTVNRYRNELRELLMDNLKDNKKYITEIGELKQKNKELEQNSCVQAVQCLTQKLEKSIEELNEEKEAGFALKKQNIEHIATIEELKNRNGTLEKENAELTAKMADTDSTSRYASGNLDLKTQNMYLIKQNMHLRKQIAKFEFERSIDRKKHNDELAKVKENAIAGIY